jgi:SHS2 domain-containing protein
MCNLESIVPQVTEEIELSGDDEIALLHDWLECLLLKFELESKVFAGFCVGRIVRSEDGLHATARISGEPYDKRKHGAKVEVKAVTYHKMEVVSQEGNTTARFILDL